MRAIKIALKIILGVALFTLIIMLLWNWLVPALFGGPAITYFQSLGLIVLSKIIFGGFGGGVAVFQRARNRRFWKKFSDKLENMTPEEKEKFRSHMCF
jgi:hypothetical protein